MKFNCLHHACAVALVALAPLAFAQTATTSGTNAAASATRGNQSAVSSKGGGTAQATTPAGSMSAQGGASGQDKGAGAETMQHDKMAHDTTHAAAKPRARHARGASTHTASHAESPYHEALKRCVEGPEGQRDSCIDQAINQYGRT